MALIKQRLDHAPAMSQGDHKSPQPQEPKATLPIRWLQQIAFSIQQFSGTEMVGGADVTIDPQACRHRGSGTSSTAVEAIAVTNVTAASVTVYNLPINPNPGGGVAPAREIRGPHTQLENPEAVAVDGAGQIYVMNLGKYPSPTAMVTVYARGANGDAAPIRTMTSSVLDPVEATGVAVDEAGEIFTSSGPSLTSPNGSGNVAVFPAGTQGSAVPAQTITDGINNPNGLAVSRDGNFLYVVNGTLPSITVYHRAFGIFALVQTIPPPANFGGWYCVAVDNAGLIYAVTSSFGVPSVTSSAPFGMVFQRDANGTFVMVGQFSGFLGYPWSIAVGPGGFVYVTEAVSGGGPDAVEVFGPNPRGLSPIIATITGPSSRLAFPLGIAIIP